MIVPRAPGTGRPEFPEEAYIKKLDGSTGASLKLTILNHSGRVWTMVAGGGASVVYADTISDYGFGKVKYEICLPHAFVRGYHESISVRPFMSRNSARVNCTFRAVRDV